MKKFILLIALSVFFYSVPGYTMPGGEKEEEAAPAKFQRGRGSGRGLRFNRRGPAGGVNQAEQLPSPLPMYGPPAPDGWPQEEAPLGNQVLSLVPVQMVTQDPHGLMQVEVVGPAALLYGPEEEAAAPVPQEVAAPDSPKAPVPEGEEEERILKHLAGSHPSPLPGVDEEDQSPLPVYGPEAPPPAAPDGGLPAEEAAPASFAVWAQERQAAAEAPALDSPKAPASKGEEDPPLGWDAGGQSPPPLGGEEELPLPCGSALGNQGSSLIPVQMAPQTHVPAADPSLLPGETEGGQLPDPAAPVPQEAAAAEATAAQDVPKVADKEEREALEAKIAAQKAEIDKLEVGCKAEKEKREALEAKIAAKIAPPPPEADPPLGDEEGQSPRPMYGPPAPDGWSPAAPAPEEVAEREAEEAAAVEAAERRKRVARRQAAQASQEEDPPLGWDAGGQSPLPGVDEEDQSSRPVYGQEAPRAAVPEALEPENE